MNIHFIGIGGIGVSSLAQYYLGKGHKISGSDLISSETTDFLRKKNIKILIGPHKKENLPKNADLVIYSPAVKKDNPEFKKALELQSERCKLRILSYPQALGEITKKHYTIAISGTHGKSTTTAMISLILIKASLDPTVIIGTKIKEFGNTNFRRGKSEYLVIEADEWNASFLNYRPKIIVLTNIEEEHLDYYKNLSHILKTYKEYIGHLPEEGRLILNSKIKMQNEKLKCKTQNYSLKLNQKEAIMLKKMLKVPGEHNIANALAALTTARILKIPDKISLKALSEYRGAWRRFEEKETVISGKKTNIVSDYGHHPTEILATIKGAREKFKNKKIWLVFQPHQHQRTFYLFNYFIKVFREISDKNFADKTIISDIFDVAGREQTGISKKISSKKLAEKIKRRNTIYLPKEKICDLIRKSVKNRDVIVIMGAGDIYKITESLQKVDI